jgi:hypothetical protein
MALKYILFVQAGIPVEFLVTAGSIHDNTAMQFMDIDLPKNSHLYADKAYLNAEMKELLLEFQQIKLKAATNEKFQREKQLGAKFRK